MVIIYEKHKYLSKYESGFKNGFQSTITAMLRNTNDWLLDMDQENFKEIAFFDLKKAFHTVDQEILLSKPNNYGISGVEYDWLISYLSGSKQSCVLYGDSSSLKFVKHGISQGSYLGALLFIICINNSPLVLKNATLLIFADDTGIFVAFGSVPAVQNY